LIIKNIPCEAEYEAVGFCCLPPFAKAYQKINFSIQILNISMGENFINKLWPIITPIW
jgi:hypothetical protein